MTVVLVVVAVGVLVGVPVYRQQVAIREIDRLGGGGETRSGGPQWLRDIVGDEWMRGFDAVVQHT